MQREVTSFQPGIEDEDLLGQHSGRCWAFVPPSCPPEIKARIIEFRKREIAGLETRSLFATPLYPDRHHVEYRHAAESRHSESMSFASDDVVSKYIDKLYERTQEEMKSLQSESQATLRRRRQQFLNSIL